MAAFLWYVMMHNIIHFVQWLKCGGAEKVVLDLASHMDKKRFGVVVCAFAGGELKNDFENAGVSLEIVRKKRALDLFFLLRLVLLVKNEGIHLIHCHGVGPTVYGAIVSKVLRIPMMITVHGRSAISVKEGIRAIKAAQKLGAKIVTVSSELRSDLINEVGVAPCGISTVVNGIDQDVYPVFSDEFISQIRASLDEMDGPVIGCVGSLREAKGHRFLIQALPKMLERFPTLIAVVVGDGELKTDLLMLTKRLRVDKNVLFLGHRSDVAELMSTFDLLIQPSLTEGISIVMLEAMCASRPIIATNVGGNSEVVEHQKTGLLVPTASPEYLSDAVIYLLENKDNRIRMGQAALERVITHFSLENTIANYEKIYFELLNQRRTLGGVN